MSLKTYKAKDGETVYDMALALYKDARGVYDVILLNPTLDLDSLTYFGQTISYDPEVVYTKEFLAELAPQPPRPKWIVRSKQSIFDLAIQVYGDIEKLAKIMAQVDSLDDPTTGALIDTERTDNFLANNVFNTVVCGNSQ